MTSSINADTAEFPVPAAPRAPAAAHEFGYSAMVEADTGGISHPGNVRASNEDHYLVVRFGRFLETLHTNLPSDAAPQTREVGYAMLVADGVGGRAAGEHASRLAILALLELVVSTPDWILMWGDADATAEVDRRAQERFRKISNLLAECGQNDPNLRGFATTMTLAVSLGPELLIAHIGDSRAYLYRDGKLHQLTRDHTLAQALVDQGLLTRHEAASHWLRHALVRALGGENRNIEADVQRVPLRDGDCVLLCTDGLTEMVREAKIASCIAGGAKAQQLCEELVEEALRSGGKDNVTAVAVRYRMPT